MSVRHLDKVVGDAFWSKVSRTDEAACWQWESALDRHGYGMYRVGVGGRRYGWIAHRLAYALSGRTIPDGLVLDHLCRNRACVNPDHLEPVTIGENIRRGLTGKVPRRRSETAAYGPRRPRRLVTHCRHGHEYTDANTYVTKDGRRRLCRECDKQRHRRQRGASRSS